MKNKAAFLCLIIVFLFAFCFTACGVAPTDDEGETLIVFRPISDSIYEMLHPTRPPKDKDDEYYDDEDEFGIQDIEVEDEKNVDEGDSGDNERREAPEDDRENQGEKERDYDKDAESAPSNINKKKMLKIREVKKRKAAESAAAESSPTNN